MSETMADRYRRWFEYEIDAHAKVVRSLESVPPDGRHTPEFQKATSILAHIAMARRVWLGRIGAAPLPSGTLFPEGVNFAQVTDDLALVHSLWSTFLSSATDADIAKDLEYKSLDSGRFHNSIEDILTQLFTHSAYHRGQIASLVRLAGGEPAKTDYIFWRRQPVVEG
jgi:uncharacterized damage-inducible protein DinB